MTYGADTHTHTQQGDMTQSLTHSNLGRPQGQKGMRGTDELSIGFVSPHKHPHSCFTDVTHTSTDSKIHKPLTRMRHWSRTMLHTLGTAKGRENKM